MVGTVGLYFCVFLGIKILKLEKDKGTVSLCLDGSPLFCFQSLNLETFQYGKFEEEIYIYIFFFCSKVQ